MKQNNHLMSEGKLLDENGNLIEPGYAFSLVKEYNRNDIKAGKGRIKEWDYYYIGNERYGIALTIDDNSYMTMISFSFLDFVNKTQITKSPLKLLTKKHVTFPSTSKIGDVELAYDDGAYLRFFNDGKKRHLVGAISHFDRDKELGVDITLTETMDGSMVIATPFDKKKHFYYNQKINCLKASGNFVIGEEEYRVDDCYGVLDWGRGVWTYNNTWYWSSLNACVDGKPIGFNLGYGFGDTSAATENMFFYDGKCYKLEDVKFEIPTNEKGKDDYMSPWKFISLSTDYKISLKFTPVLNRQAITNVVIIESIQNQVFGYFDGFITVDGVEYQINHLLGFAEKVKNKW